MKTVVFSRMVLLSAGLMLVQANDERPGRHDARGVGCGSGSGRRERRGGVVRGVREGVAADPSGNVYVADTRSLERSGRLTPDGRRDDASRGAGAPGTRTGSEPTPGSWGPLGVAADASGNVRVADSDDGGRRFLRPVPEGDHAGRRRAQPRSCIRAALPSRCARGLVGEPVRAWTRPSGLWKIAGGRRSRPGPPSRAVRMATVGAQGVGRGPGDGRSVRRGLRQQQGFEDQRRPAS